MKKTITTHYDSPQDYLENMNFECENCYLNTRELYSNATNADDISELIDEDYSAKEIVKHIHDNKIGFTIVETIKN